MDEIPAQDGGSRVPAACNLPEPEQPLRLAEFDRLFTTAVRAVDRPDRQRVRLELTPDAAVAARVADLMMRESRCCGFFTFTLTASDGRLWLDVQVPGGQAGVLDSLVDRAVAGGQP